MSKSDYLENQLLNHVLGGSDYTRPGTVHVSLHTANTGETGSGAEVSGGSYARVAVTNNATNFPAASGGAKSNGSVFTFPTATASWGTVSHFGIWDASSGGNLLYYGALAASNAVGIGDTPSFPIGALDITED